MPAVDREDRSARPLAEPGLGALAASTSFTEPTPLRWDPMRASLSAARTRTRVDAQCAARTQPREQRLEFFGVQPKTEWLKWRSKLDGYPRNVPVASLDVGDLAMFARVLLPRHEIGRAEC